MASKEGTNAQVILTIGAVSGFTVIVLVIGLQAWFLSEERSETEAKFAGSVKLTEAEWVEVEKRSEKYLLRKSS